jgi:hypothetical protein
MKQLVEKLVTLERGISAERGAFVLFALFLREDSPNRWDLVVAAPWLKTDKKESWDYVANQLQSRLTPQELVSLSRIVLIDEDNPALEAIYKAIKIEHSIAEIKNCNFFRLSIKHAYIITAKNDHTESNSRYRRKMARP